MSRSRRLRASLLTFAVIAIAASLGGVALAADTRVQVTNGGSDPYDYTPPQISIAVGDTVTWSNPVVHNNGGAAAGHPTACAAKQTNRGKTKGDCPWSNFDLDPGQSHTQSFPAEGTFQYNCLVHPYMLGTIVVGDGEPGDPPPPPPPSPTATATTTTPPPNPSANPSPTASATPSPGASPTTTDAPSASPEAPTATTDPTASASPSASPTASATPSTTASPSDGGTVSLPSDGGEGGGGGTKAIATLLLVGSAGALWRFRTA